MPIDYKKYPRDWFTRIVPAVRSRSGNKCEECGLMHGQTVMSFVVKKIRKFKTVYRREWSEYMPKEMPKGGKLVKVVLTVAHLDNDAHNHKVELSRLQHLCQKCHLKADAYYKAIKRQCGHYCNYPTCSPASCQFNPL